MSSNHRQTLVAIILVVPILVFGQLSLEWELSVPGGGTGFPSYSANSHKSLKSIATDDGGFIVLGHKAMYGSEYPNAEMIYVFKHDEQSNLVWEYEYETEFGIHDESYDIAQDNNGNIYIGGTELEFYKWDWEYPDIDSRFLLVKLDPDGEFLWKKSLYGGANGSVLCHNIAIDANDNIYTSGNFRGENAIHATVNKFSSNGDSLWGASVWPGFAETMHLNDSTVMLISRGASELIVHFSLAGVELYRKQLDLINSSRNPPKFDADGNIYMCHSTGEFKLIKMDMYGDTLWQYSKQTNLPHNIYADEMKDMSVDDKGYVYATGRYYGAHYGDPELYSNCDILTVKLDPTGKLIWENIYRFDNTSSCQVGNKVLAAENGNVYVTGRQSVSFDDDLYYSKDKVLLTYDEDGNLLDSLYHDGTHFIEDIGINMRLSVDAIYVYGWALPENGAMTQDVIKYSLTTATHDLAAQARFPVLYPNPADDRFQIDYRSELDRVVIYDLLGRTVYIDRTIVADEPIVFGDLAFGAYAVLMVTKQGEVFTERLIVK
ncbi:MAG: hypothetical protein DRI69_05150 [Bacteroidetes bacterium]|nr:MAG: hypothetical protein DRI69_05150 [Bacteroidota bacterium]